MTCSGVTFEHGAESLAKFILLLFAKHAIELDQSEHSLGIPFGRRMNAPNLDFRDLAAASIHQVCVTRHAIRHVAKTVPSRTQSSSPTIRHDVCAPRAHNQPYSIQKISQLRGRLRRQAQIFSW
jgi:hypothetical protein